MSKRKSRIRRLMVNLKIYKEYGEYTWKGKEEGTPPESPYDMSDGKFIWINPLTYIFIVVYFIFALISTIIDYIPKRK